MTKAGAGVLILTGSDVYSGVTTISAGTLQVGSGSLGSIGSTSGVLDNGVLAFANTTTATTFTHSISGSGSLLVEIGYNHALRLTGSNSYTGPTVINTGIIDAGNAVGNYGLLPSATSVTITGTGGALWIGGTQTIASLSDGGSSGGKVVGSATGASTLTLAPSAGSTTTYSGSMYSSAGTLALVLNGPGTQILAGSNTYAGGTTIQNGVLGISNDYNLGASSGTLSITGGTLQSTGAVTLSASRPVRLGAAAGINVPSGTLVYGGALPSRLPWSAAWSRTAPAT